MKRLLGMIGLLFPILLLGCSGSLQSAKYARDVESGKLSAAPEPSEYCKSLDAQRSTFAFLGKLGLGGSTVAAGSVAYWKDERSDNIAALTAAGLAAVSGGLLWLSGDKAATWVRDCQ